MLQRRTPSAEPETGPDEEEASREAAAEATARCGEPERDVEKASPDRPTEGTADGAEEQDAPAGPSLAAPYTPKPPLLAAAYMTASVLLALTQGLGMNLVTANIPKIQGAIGATSTEATWLVAAYMAPNVSLALALIKIRTQYGLRNFAEASILVFVLVCLLNLLISDLQSAVVVRFFSGVAAAPMSTMAFLYMLEPFPPEKKLAIGLPLALTNLSLGAPLARIISPPLIDAGGWQHLTVLELALAMLAFCLVYLMPLTPPPRAKIIEKMDIVSYLLIAVGFGCTAVVLVLGRPYWWLEAPWIGETLIAAVLCITAAAVIELNRENPLLDIRWLTSPAIVHFTAALLIFRIVLSEQTTGAAGLFQALGLSNDQMQTLYWVIVAASVAGGLSCAAVLKPERVGPIHTVALTILAIGAFMDSHSTVLTRPGNMLVSQALIAFASALFLPPALISGLMSALKKGPNYILSFIIVFLTTQSIGGLLGAAVFGTFISIRQRFHTLMLFEHLRGTDPLVATRIGQLSGAYAKVISDQSILNAEGVALLQQQVTQQATVLAYNDAFRLIGILALAALAALIIHMSIDALRSRLATATAPAN